MRLVATACLFASAAALVAAAPAEDGLKPGLWQETTTVTGATMAGLPARLPLPKPVTRTLCIAPTLAADPGRWFAEDRSDGDCTVARSRAGGGRVELAGVCEAAGVRDAATTASRGRYDADDYALDVATTLGGPAQAVVVTSRVTASRVGDCTAAG